MKIQFSNNLKIEMSTSQYFSKLNLLQSGQDSNEISKTMCPQSIAFLFTCPRSFGDNLTMKIQSVCPLIEAGLQLTTKAHFSQSFEDLLGVNVRVLESWSTPRVH